MSSKTHYVYSTLSSSMNYQNYEPGGGDLSLPAGSVVIQGGANIPDKYLRTPDGAVITPVTEEELAILQSNSVFQLHVKNGFIVVKDKKADGEAVAADMESRDQSAPLVDADFEAAGQPTPTTKAPDDEDKPSGNKRRA